MYSGGWGGGGGCLCVVDVFGGSLCVVGVFWGSCLFAVGVFGGLGRGRGVFVL